MAEKKTKDGLGSAIDAINKRYGAGSVMKLGDKPKVDIDVIPSGSFTLDLAMGIGGFPKGRMVSISGPESSGKTSLAIHTIANCQKAGGTAAFVDVECAFDPTYAENLGVSLDDLIFSQPNGAEEALNIIEDLIKSKEVDIVVLDSVAALVPRAELEGEMGDSTVGLQARLMSQAMRKLTSIVSKSNCCLMLLNQLRATIGNFYGPSEVEPGGNAIKFYASIRLDIRRSGAPLKDKESVAYGNSTKIKVVKNKLAPPFKVAQFDIIYGKGISYAGEVLDLAESLKIVEKAGSWYSYNDAKLGQGRDGVRDMLEDNEELLKEIADKVLAHYSVKAKE